MAEKHGARPTLKDIAAKTGYSVNTVSRALRNMPDISMETREKIREVARAMGYRGNALASSLRLGRSKTLAAIVPDISNLFFTLAVVEIEMRARAAGYTTILINTSESGQFEREAIHNVLEKSVDGIVFSPAQHAVDNTLLLRDSGTPFVLLARRFEGVHVDYVVADDTLGGFQATTHLIEKGHKNILLLNGLSQHNSSALGREAGYTRAHEAAGLPVQPDLKREVSLMGRDCAQVLAHVFRQRSDITAVFAYSDLVAWSAIAWFQANGIRVPEDISIVGFDNIQGHINIPYPLTTVDIHITQMAATAVDALVNKLNAPDSHKVILQAVIPTEFAPGGTVLPFYG